MRTAIHVEYLSGYLTCLCQEDNSVDNVFHVRYFPHWIRFLKRAPGIILVQWRVHDSGGYGVKADTFFCILDCETAYTFVAHRLDLMRVLRERSLEKGVGPR